MKSITPSLLLLVLFLFSNFSKLESQVPNDSCENATLISINGSDLPFECVISTNLGALPETFNNSCNIGNFPTVWFQVNTPPDASLININVSSSDFDAPTIALFGAFPDCSSLQSIPLTQSNLPCVVGSNGEAEAIASDVGANSTYYIAVSSLNSTGGQFEICVNTIS